MLNTLYLLNYNNYYDRIVKKEDSLEGYLQYSVVNPIQNVNFIPGDYVDTQQVVNIPDDIHANYLLVVQDNKIVSRWFIVNYTKTTANQLNLTLHRDLVVDKYDTAINADCFIEKATLDNDDPMIFNSEDMTFNQIKTSETPLMDESGCAWIVGYINNNPNTNYNKVTFKPKYNPDLTFNSLEDVPIYKYTTNRNSNVRVFEFKSYVINAFLRNSDTGTKKATYSGNTVTMNGNGSIRYDIAPIYIYHQNDYADQTRFPYQSRNINTTGTINFSTQFVYYPTYQGSFSNLNNAYPTLGNSRFENLYPTSNYTNSTYGTYNYSLLTSNRYSYSSNRGGAGNTVVVNNTYSFLERFPYYKIRMNDMCLLDNNKYYLTESDLQYNRTTTGYPAAQINIDDVGGTFSNTKISVHLTTNRIIGLKGGRDAIKNTIDSEFSDIMDGLHKVYSYLNRIIYIASTNKYYKLIVEEETSNSADTTASTIISKNNSPSIYNIIMNNYIAFNTDEKFLLTFLLKGYKATLTELNSLEAEYTIPSWANRDHLIDAPYDMFCIPYSNGQFIIAKPGDNYTTDKLTALSVAMSMYEGLGTANVYDIQLLPYCPFRYILQQSVAGNTSINIQNYSYTSVKTVVGNNPICAIIFGTISHDEFNIPINIQPSDSLKISSECDKYRLCSPNYSGLFEFNVAMNGGVDFINVDFQYKPINPYIHMNPNFKNLYGSDFNDSRGLICTGDFSLPAINSSWTTYEYSNKNYQLAFDRQIQNMEVNNAVQREKEQWQLAAGVLQGAAQGAQMGSNTFLGLGGLFGMDKVGAAAGAGIAYAAGKRDMQLNDQLRKETLDYTKDQFGYALGNIQAQPYGLAKVSAITPNNKIFPFIEYYTCTEEEKKALQNKLKYNGMTVMRIGKIKDFMKTEKTYIKGKLIRPDENYPLNDDYHILLSLANELNQGVYI